MHLETPETFLAIVEEGSLVRAARKLLVLWAQAQRDAAQPDAVTARHLSSERLHLLADGPTFHRDVYPPTASRLHRMTIRDKADRSDVDNTPTGPDNVFRVSTKDVDLESDLDNLALAIHHLQEAVVPESQEHARQQILDFCSSHEDALHRSSLTGHLTASAFVVDLATNAVALIHHRKLERWLQPGGHADGEGNLLRVAATEVAEEIGLTNLSFVVPAFDIDVHAIPERGDVPDHLHLDLRFLALATDTPTLNGNDETNDAVWVGLDDPRMNDGAAVSQGASRAVELAAEIVGSS